MAIDEEKFELGQHEQYLVNLFAAVIGKDYGIFETPALMMYIEKRYNQIKEEIIPSLEEIISGNFSEFLPQTFGEPPNPTIRYRPVMSTGKSQQFSGAQIRSWRFLKDPNIISAGDINTVFGVKKRQKIFPESYAKGSYLELGQARDACSFLIEVAHENDFPRNEILKQFCPVNLYLGDQSSKAIVPWIGLLFGMEYQALHKIPGPSSTMPGPPGPSATKPVASSPVEDPGYAQAAAPDRFSQHYKDMLWLIEKVSLTSTSSPKFAKGLREGFNAVHQNPASISRYLIGDNNRSNCCYVYKIYEGKVPEIRWEGKDWEWFKPFSIGFSPTKIYEKKSGILIPILPPERERILGQGKDAAQTVLLPAEGIVLTGIYQKHIRRGK